MTIREVVEKCIPKEMGGLRIQLIKSLESFAEKEIDEWDRNTKHLITVLELKQRLFGNSAEVKE